MSETGVEMNSVLHGTIHFISLILIVSALMLLGADAITSLEKGGQIYVRSLEDLWTLLDKGGMDAFKAWTTSALPGFLAHGIGFMLALPGWSIGGVIGVLLAFLRPQAR